MRHLLSLLLLPLLGCTSSYDAANDTEGFEPTGGPPTDTATPPVIEEGWASFEGTVQVVEGVAHAATITLSLWEPDRFAEPTVSCSVTLPVQAPAGVTQPVDEVTVFGLWEIDTTNSTCLGTPSRVPLGIGPLPRELWPAADAKGASTRQTRGLYTVWNGELVVFGLAGTPQMLQGRGAPVTLEPLPDGTYELSTAYLLEL